MKKVIFILLLCFPTFLLAKTFLDEFDDSSSSSTIETFDESSLSEETIKKISPSRRIFVITNENNSFSDGDYISIILHNKLVARGIVAKNINNRAGVKIIKIYSLVLWKLLRPSLKVKILRGDDSYFKIKKEKKKKNIGQEGQINDETDLFNDTGLLEDKLTLDDEDTRSIKTDNVLGISYGALQNVEISGSSSNSYQPLLHWQYQFETNIWGELIYGQNNVNDYPALGLDTRITNVILRVKYSFAAPFYSYIQPYAGYQIIDASSPGAGQGIADTTQAQDELQAVERMKKNSAIFGMTVLKRLVPGWFLRLNVGTDMLSGGFSLEF